MKFHNTRAFESKMVLNKQNINKKKQGKYKTTQNEYKIGENITQNTRARSTHRRIQNKISERIKHAEK